jgi:hypothetical protein
VNTFFADAGLVNGKCEVPTTHVSVDGTIDWAAVTGETVFSGMG